MIVCSVEVSLTRQHTEDEEGEKEKDGVDDDGP